MPRGVYKRKEGIYPKVPKSKEHIEKLSLNQKGKLKGNKAWNWNGGSAKEPYSIDWTLSLKRSIRERDHYVCQLCSIPQTDMSHSVHHIDYNKFNCNPDNLVTLCIRCHSKTNVNRSYWIEYFKNKNN